MTFAERFSQLLQHLLRNLLQRRQSVWKALLWGAVTVVVIGFVAGLGAGGGPLPDPPPPHGAPAYHPPPLPPLYSPRQQENAPLFLETPSPCPPDKSPRP